MAETTDALLAEVKRQFLRRAGTVRMKKDTYEAANIYAQDLGELLADVFRDVLKEDALPDGRLYRETADAVVRPMMEEAYKKAADAAKTAQNALNESAGIGLKAVEPMSAAEKAEQITYVVDNACRPNDYAAEMNLLGRETVQFSRKVVDSSIRKNAEFQYNAGIEATVTRVYDGRGLHDGKSPCTWCLARAGTDVPYKEAYAKGMFERHPGCGCVITYRSAKGVVTRQGAGMWQSNSWSKVDERARERRIAFSAEGDRKTGLQALSRIYVNKDDRLSKNMEKVKPIKGYEDFGSHGSTGSVSIETNNGQETTYSAKEYADILRLDPAYHGGKIRLLACSTGAERNGFAQQLSNELKVDVMAPTETLWVGENGELFISDSEVLSDLWYNNGDIDESIKQTGRWKVFHPGERK